uniref:KIB1-4 beta-propeller domain-containing protein n=1 Tax=Oryza punctata TaxID=4537 RepID=A0A0E0M4F8_ORYPU
MDATLADDEDLVGLICSRLPCLFDQIGVQQLSRCWRAAVARLPPPLPLILLPDGGPLSCVAAGLCSHNLRIPEYARGARYFGAYAGGWVFLAIGHSSDHVLFNLRTHQIIRVPDQLRISCHHLSRSREAVIIAATLSSSPTDPNCIGAAISQGRSIGKFVCTFWLLRVSKLALGINVSHSHGLEDLIYYDGAFHFLTSKEDLLIFRLSEFSDDGLISSASAQQVIRSFSASGDGRDYGSHRVLRYLVESRGNLLMVTRILSAPKIEFKLFEMEEKRTEPLHNGSISYNWKQIHSLDGRILFLARGCSKSYDMSDYPELEDAIYFLDDGRSYKDYTFFSEGAVPRYPCCSDSGKWLEAKKPGLNVVEFLREQEPSTCSPPTWFFP